VNRKTLLLIFGNTYRGQFLNSKLLLINKGEGNTMSVVNRFIGTQEKYEWENVVPKAYTGKEGILKHVLIGQNEGSENFIIRYFVLEPGRSSNLERHEHEHGVVIVHGKGKVQLNDEFIDVGPMDAIFISPNDLHQLTNVGEDSFGFICVIKANI